MTSKAGKLRARRAARSAGRPRKQGVDRYPNGEIKNHEIEREAMSVAKDARLRMYKTDSPFAAYTLGRIFLDGAITETQREAGDTYAAMMARYYRLVGIPFPSARAQSLFSIHGHDGDQPDSLIKRARAASNRMMEIEGVLLRLPNGPQIKSTIYNVCVLDVETMRTMPEMQMDMLRRGLNELHFKFGLQGDKKSDIPEITSSECAVKATRRVG